MDKQLDADAPTLWQRVFPEGRLIRLAFVALCMGCSLGLSTRLTHAQTQVDCSSNTSNLAQQSQNGTLSGVIAVKGTCVGQVFLSKPGITLQQDPAGGKIQGTVTITAAFATLSSITVDGTGSSRQGIQVFGGAASTTLTDVIVQNFADDSAISATDGSLTINGGKITGSLNCGLYLNGRATASLGSDSGSHGVEITGNGISANPGQTQGGICVSDGAMLAVSSADIHDNLQGPALSAYNAFVDITGGTFQAPSSVAFPTFLFKNAKIGIAGATIQGTGHSDVIFAAPGNSVIMQNTTVSESDATATDSTILIEDGSTLLSLGGNTITNSAVNGQAITVGNAATFRQKIETSLGITIVADTITGKGAVLIESNMDLGTGSSAPSTWNGNINVSQNSSFRVEGGLTINGSVSVAQASNAFFNLANNPGTANNVITGGVLCPFTSTQSSHVSVSGNAAVTSPGGSTSAVTFGSAANDCLGF